MHLLRKSFRFAAYLSLAFGFGFEFASSHCCSCCCLSVCMFVCLSVCLSVLQLTSCQMSVELSWSSSSFCQQKQKSTRSKSKNSAKIKEGKRGRGRYTARGMERRERRREKGGWRNRAVLKAIITKANNNLIDTTLQLFQNSRYRSLYTRISPSHPPLDTLALGQS